MSALSSLDLFSLSPLFGSDFDAEPQTQPTQTGTNRRSQMKGPDTMGGVANKTPAYGIVPLSEG